MYNMQAFTQLRGVHRGIADGGDNGRIVEMEPRIVDAIS